MFIYCLVVLISGLICGAITYKINTEKGYDGGFAWGFLLGVIGIVVVACRADNIRYYNEYSNSEYDSRLSSLAVETQKTKLLNDGGWVCSNCLQIRNMLQLVLVVCISKIMIRIIHVQKKTMQKM
ncbi:MAG: hypothetical protein MR503_01085 [Oscillospiraceae bacterium]|nr:hypothetical protein [Oscillospiraceae bacterium]